MKSKTLSSLLKTLAGLSLAMTACQGGPSSEIAAGLPNMSGPSSIAKGTRKFTTDILLYTGSGTWGAEVGALEDMIPAHGATYDTVTEASLNAMSLDELSQYGMIVWPGGLANTEVSGLTQATRAKLRQAVQERGVGYVGFCAGSFVAVGSDAGYNIGIVSGPPLEYYSREAYYEKNGGTDIEMTMTSFANGSKRDIVWYGGPMTQEIQGGVIARYPDGTPEISQMWSGNGFVILSGTHPTAPDSVRTSYGLNDSDGNDQDIAWSLINAVLRQQELPAF
jgi:glutamine amidotransferase-like uncharacterized protein